jgi:hypothetical protein
VSVPGWYQDPSGRFEHRYHNGAAWTADVATGGRRFVDPLRSAPASNGMAVAALVLGITATALGWLPFVAVVMLVAAVVAICLGAAARRRARRRGTSRSFATWGLGFGIAGVPVSLLGLVVTVVFVRAVDRYDRPNASTVDVIACVEEGGLVLAEGWIVNDGRDAASFTIRVALSHAADGERAAVDRVEIDDVAPGARAEWRARARPVGVASGTPDCAVRAVHGPLPFGFDPGA